jgi:hypothetical protein
MKRLLGQDHPDTLTLMANLVSYRNHRRWKEAEELFVQAGLIKSVCYLKIT